MYSDMITFLSIVWDNFGADKFEHTAFSELT
jgi:hypothetical protein